MQPLDPSLFSPACAPLLQDSPLSSLGPGRPNGALRATLQTLDVADLTGSHTVQDPQMALCCLSALWLRHDFLDESHTISQNIDSVSGSYWHGIMHRREPDYSNAKYWFRRVGQHPIFEQLDVEAGQRIGRPGADQELPELAHQTDWDPFLFVDLCQDVHGTGTQRESICQEIAELEWRLLFEFCYRQAIGS